MPRFETRVSDDELALWKAAAALEGVTLSEWVRQVVNEELGVIQDGAPVGQGTLRERIGPKAACRSSYRTSFAGGGPTGIERLGGRVGFGVLSPSPSEGDAVGVNPAPYAQGSRASGPWITLALASSMTKKLVARPSGSWNNPPASLHPMSPVRPQMASTPDSSFVTDHAVLPTGPWMLRSGRM